MQNRADAEREAAARLHLVDVQKLSVVHYRQVGHPHEQVGTVICLHDILLLAEQKRERKEEDQVLIVLEDEEFPECVHQIYLELTESAKGGMRLEGESGLLDRANEKGEEEH